MFHVISEPWVMVRSKGICKYRFSNTVVGTSVDHMRRLDPYSCNEHVNRSSSLDNLFIMKCKKRPMCLCSTVDIRFRITCSDPLLLKAVTRPSSANFKLCMHGQN